MNVLIAKTSLTLDAGDGVIDFSNTISEIIYSVLKEMAHEYIDYVD